MENFAKLVNFIQHLLMFHAVTLICSCQGYTSASSSSFSALLALEWDQGLQDFSGWQFSSFLLPKPGGSIFFDYWSTIACTGAIHSDMQQSLQHVVLQGTPVPGFHQLRLAESPFGPAGVTHRDCQSYILLCRGALDRLFVTSGNWEARLLGVLSSLYSFWQLFKQVACHNILASLSQ